MDDFLSNELKKILDSFSGEEVVREYNGSTYTLIKPNTLDMLEMHDYTMGSDGRPIMHIFVPYVLENFVKEIDSGECFTTLNDQEIVFSLVEDIVGLIEG